MGCAPLAHSLPPCDHLCAAHLCYIGHGTHLLRGGPDDVPWAPLQLLWRTLTDERLDLCESVKSVPVCEDIVHMGVDAALASRYQFRGQDLIVCGSVDGHGGPVPPWCPHGSTVRCGHPSGPAYDVGTSGSMVRDPQGTRQPVRTCSVIRIHKQAYSCLCVVRT